jgi:hypothetical protein
MARSTSAVARVRLALLALAFVGMAALAVVLASSSGPEPPATGTAAVVPANVLAYVHVSTDPRRPAVRNALALGPRLPTYPLIAAQVIARLTALIGGGANVDFDRDIRPWLGREVALALLNTSTSSAGSELVLDVARPAAARAFVARAGALPDGSYRSTKLYRYRSGATLAFLRHYLVLGQDASVRAGIDAASGAAPSLASSDLYRQAASGEPADRVLDAYVSSEGVQRLLMPRGGVFGALGALLTEPALTGSTLSLSASGDTARLYVHSALARSAAPREFSPSLERLLPAGTLLALDMAGARATAPRVLGAASWLGIGEQIGPLLRRLGGALAAEGVDVGRIESLFSGETAVAVAPDGALVVLTRVTDPQAVSAEVANLAVPLTQLFPAPSSGSGEIPQFADTSIDGITAHELSLGTGVRLDYALFHRLLVISTSLDAIGAVARQASSLTAQPGYRAALGGTPSHVTSLVFLDFSQLLNLAERTGLLRGARFGALAPDIRRIRAAGLDSTRGEADSTAELTLQIK